MTFNIRCGAEHCRELDVCVVSQHPEYCPADGDSEQPQEPEPPSNDNSDQVSVGALQRQQGGGCPNTSLWRLGLHINRGFRMYSWLPSSTQNGHAAANILGQPFQTWSWDKTTECSAILPLRSGSSSTASRRATWSCCCRSLASAGPSRSTALLARPPRPTGCTCSSRWRPYLQHI